MLDGERTGTLSLSMNLRPFRNLHSPLGPLTYSPPSQIPIQHPFQMVEQSHKVFLQFVSNIARQSQLEGPQFIRSRLLFLFNKENAIRLVFECEIRRLNVQIAGSYRRKT